MTEAHQITQDYFLTPLMVKNILFLHRHIENQNFGKHNYFIAITYKVENCIFTETINFSQSKTSADVNEAYKKIIKLIQEC